MKNVTSHEGSCKGQYKQVSHGVPALPHHNRKHGGKKQSVTWGGRGSKISQKVSRIIRLAPKDHKIEVQLC